MMSSGKGPARQHIVAVDTPNPKLIYIATKTGDLEGNSVAIDAPSLALLLPSSYLRQGTWKATYSCDRYTEPIATKTGDLEGNQSCDRYTESY